MRKRTFQIALVLSLFLHVGFAFYLYLKKPSEPKAPEYIEISLNETTPQMPTDELSRDAVVEKKKQSESKLKQIVQQESTVNDEVPQKDAYLSAKNQTVKEETRALLTGKFKNSGMTGKGKPTAEADEQKKENAKVSKTAKALQMDNEEPSKNNSLLPSQKTSSGLPTLAALKPKFKWNEDSQEMRGFNGVGDASQTSDYLKDQKTGNQTLLNTREFVYYTYYNRIRAQLEQYWGPTIKEKVRKIFAQGRKIASDEDHITRVLITLDKMGTLVNVQVVGASGVRDLDEAAIEAFRAAAPFPNPPLGIVDSDGTIKIRWDFVIES